MQIEKSKFNIIFLAFIGSTLTWILNHKMGYGPIVSNGLIGVFAGIFLPKTLAGTTYAASFVGMSGISIIPSILGASLGGIIIGIVLSKQLGGLPSITVVAIIMTGIIGSIVGPFLYSIFKIKDKVALGIAMGASAHALGTARAMEIGETEGAMSGLTMAISGIVAVLLYPVLWKMFLAFLK